MMRAFPVRFLIVLLVTCNFCASAWAQSKGAAAANDAAYALFLSGNYAGAAAAYEKVLADYPTDGGVSASTIQLAFSQFFMGDYEKAQKTLSKVVAGPGLPPELAQLADNFLPQILSAKAAAMPVSSPQRKTAFEEAVKKFSDFITKYPQATELESAIYERALANFQIQKFDKVVEDMEENIKRFPQSGTIDRSKDLLALAWATQGSNELIKDGGDKSKGLAILNKAKDILRNIIKGKGDTALINEAYFQIGEILFTQAAYCSDDERAPVFQEALEAYRSILPKEEIIAIQKEKIASFPALKDAAIRARNLELAKQLDKDRERENRKLLEISMKPEQVAAAILKIGEIFFNWQNYNEARALIRHASPFLATDDEKKRVLYFNAMTYALQHDKEKAIEAYDKFFEGHSKDPMADTLPFAMGGMYLSLKEPEMAVKYFEESLNQYPNGRLAKLTVATKAEAEAAMQKFDEARKTFESCLAKNPAPDVKLVALYGLAGISRDTGRWDEAITGYKSVIAAFPESEKAVDSQFQIAYCTLKTSNYAAAEPLFEAFVSAHGDHLLTPTALYLLATAQVSLGKKDAGIASMAKIAEKFPDSTAAAPSYISRARLLAGDGKTEEVNALLRIYIEKYPQNEEIFSAYDMLARNAASAKKPDEAIELYMKFVQEYPKDTRAAEALLKAADIQRGIAERIALNYSALGPEDQSKWKKAVEQSEETLESLFARYPTAPLFASAIQSLMTSERLLLRAQPKDGPALKDDAAVESHLQSLANKCDDAEGKSKILLSLASFIYEKDKARGLAKMNEAFNPKIVYSSADLNVYGMALLTVGKSKEASDVFQKIAADYPIPAGMDPKQAPLALQEAQATSLFGLGSIAQEKKQVVEAGKLFQKLKSTYPRSPKVVEADFGIADALRVEGKFDEAVKLLTPIARSTNTNVTNELRAKSMLLGGFIMKDKMNAATDPKVKENFQGSAIDYFIKIARFYSDAPVSAATGLWEGAQLLEDRAAAAPDSQAKAQHLARAKETYSQLVKDFPNSEFAPKAKARLAALGGS